MLALLAILLSVASPGLRRVLDRSVVVSSREEVLALVHRARAIAPEAGGATLRLDRSSDRAELFDGAGTRVAVVDLSDRRVDLQVSGSDAIVDLRWNALGWGIVASRSLTLARGGLEARLVISSRGRAARR